MNVARCCGAGASRHTDAGRRRSSRGSCRSGRDAAPVPQPVDTPLHGVAVPVQRRVAVDRPTAGAAALLAVRRLVDLLRDHHLDPLQDRDELRAVAGLSRREHERRRATAPVGREMDLAGQSAAGTPQFGGLQTGTVSSANPAPLDMGGVLDLSVLRLLSLDSAPFSASKAAFGAASCSGSRAVPGGMVVGPRGRRVHADQAQVDPATGCRPGSATSPRWSVSAGRGQARPQRREMRLDQGPLLAGEIASRHADGSPKPNRRAQATHQTGHRRKSAELGPLVTSRRVSRAVVDRFPADRARCAFSSDVRTRRMPSS
ncbi:hypothetical protein EDD39_5257 [Kitasatospora cineracea]|uniref:Uncharacterized protein n=1 Tax=Kitasatospora cineracea TaxID=88074 RepID=A0A8G1USD0_9ACTN|nr:hypothetical protein EDD39_5257 [Kitasatospora cineracea]